MSHIVTHGVVFDHLPSVKKICKQLGWPFLEGKKTYRWYHSGWMDDSPIPQHLFSPEQNAKIAAMTAGERTTFMNGVLGHCEHAISVPGCSYEIGIVKNWRGELVPIWDWFSTGGLQRVLGTPENPEKNPLLQGYQIERMKFYLDEKGRSYTETWNPESQVMEIDVKPKVGVWG